MPNKIDATRFVEGRDAYVKRVPMLEVFARIGEIEETADSDTAAESFVFGFLDGVICDIREAAAAARRR